MTERRKFGKFKQHRFITVIETDNSCGIEDLMKQKKYKGFREKDYHKLESIRDELNDLYYENEQLKQSNKILRINRKDCEKGRIRERKSFNKFDKSRVEHIRFLQKRLKENNLSIYKNE